ncbi:phosphoadenosine phosphosulfate reductase [Xenorhabdus bovienii]|nr:phosphoadenosine phosphosulfate reductase [Xenorhabdus bovienii]MDE9490530.1 phosphoadenosine phosphosulfate reductase [Xenorhabdus bovienii]MDE9507221.1 phosphoadenosine phosphosulfate reductase [Xenorhabdus bovienii]
MSYGGGTNSVALLIGLLEIGLMPDLITFADTGCEKPHTYSYLPVINNWLLANGGPQITICKKVFRQGRTKAEWVYEEKDLYTYYRERNMLPAVAYGFKNCSQKFKIEPQEKEWNNHPLCKAEWARGAKVTMLVGYDFDEETRVLNARRTLANDAVLSKKFQYEYPLYDWEWDRDACISAIQRAGLPRPGKSSCWCCPYTKKPELLRLQQDHPELVEKALVMEQSADLKQIKGLGRRWNWGNFLNNPDGYDRDELDHDMPCGCYDG